MTKLAKLLARNKRLAYFLIIIIEAIALGIILAHFNITSSFLRIFLVVFLATFTYLFVYTSPMYLVKKMQDEFNEKCNPEPFLHIIEELLSYKISEGERTNLLIDYCAPLCDMGEFQKAYDILTGINIDKKAGTPSVVKAVYYNNLAYACYMLGDNASADIWCEKMLQIYRDMPQNKFKKMLDDTSLISSAEKSYRNGDYSGAMILINQAELKHTRIKVNAALLRAQIYLKAENIENAKKELDYVISNGNKCYDVVRAKEILSEIE
jgi:tetratricopeptide (TPR) repeat protein